MLIKKSNYIYRIKFTNINSNPVIFFLKSDVDINMSFDYDIGSFGYRPIYVPKQPECTVTLKNLSLSNFIELQKMINNVLSGAIQGRGYGLDYRINMEIKKRNQIIHVYNVMPDFNTSTWPVYQPGYEKYLSVTLRGDYAEYIYLCLKRNNSYLIVKLHL